MNVVEEKFCSSCLVEYSVKGPNEPLATVLGLDGEGRQGKLPKVEQPVPDLVRVLFRSYFGFRHTPVLVKQLERVLCELVQL